MKYTIQHDGKSLLFDTREGLDAYIHECIKVGGSPSEIMEHVRKKKEHRWKKRTTIYAVVVYMMEYDLMSSRVFFAREDAKRFVREELKGVLSMVGTEIITIKINGL